MIRRCSIVATCGCVGLLLAACTAEENSPGTNSNIGGGSNATTTPAGGAATTSGSGGTVATGGSTAFNATGGSVTAPSTGGAATSSTGGRTAFITGGSPGASGQSSGLGASSSTGGKAGTGGAGSLGGGTSAGGKSAGGAVSTGGAKAVGGASSGGAKAVGGAIGSGGAKALGGASGAVGTGGAAGASGLSKFSFFVTSLAAVRALSGNQNGFGGDLRYGQSTGLAGADKICGDIAERSMPGARAKQWRAFLSTTSVNAIDRVGTGPWYDRLGRVVAQNLQGLVTQRPTGDAAIISDLPNEDGALNHNGSAENGQNDNHDTITGSNASGKWDNGSTCSDWTNATGSDGPRVGHSWPAASGQGWIQAHTAPGCEPSVALTQTGAGSGNGIGNGGGYGGFYCFALQP